MLVLTSSSSISSYCSSSQALPHDTSRIRGIDAPGLHSLNSSCFFCPPLGKKKALVLLDIVFVLSNDAKSFSFVSAQKPRVTEIHVRMDCNGCVQKIKKALHGINGIYDLYIDFPQQKLTIVGWADPERIVKAIRKTRKNATICSHTEPSSDQPSEPTEQAPNGGEPPPAEAANPSQPEGPPSEPPKEHPPQENPPPPPPQQAENPQPDANPPPAATANPQEGQPPQQESQPPPPSMPKDVGEVHVVYHHPPDYGYRSYGYNRGYNGHYYKYPSSSSSSSHQAFQHEPPPPPPVYVTHSYNTYKPSPYVTEYEYARSPPPPPPQYNYSQYRSMDHYGEASHSSYAGAAGSGNITSIFSEENPNACRVM